MRSTLSWLGGVLLALLAGGGPGARAMNYSIPYVRHDLNFSLDTFGYGSTLGLLEVNNGDNAILTYSNAPEWGLQTFRDVQDFSGYAPVTTNDSTHGTLVAHILDNMYTYDSQSNIPYTAMNLATDYISPWSIGMAPRASYYGALFDGNTTKAAFLSLNSSLSYLTATSRVQAINNSWGATVSQASDLNGLSDYALLMDEYAGYHGKTGGTTGGYRDTLMVVAAGNSGTDTGLLGTPADSYNGLAVGALDVGSRSNYIDDPNRHPLPQVAPFSSWRPLADGRCGVGVVAPGSWIAVIENFTVGTDTNNNLVLQNMAGVLGDGTSFAAPHVTGLAGILYGAPQHPLDNTETLISTTSSTLKGTPFSTDHKLIKALIINGADKIAGLDANGVAQAAWQPGLITVGLDGVTNSLHPLNYAVGAGQANAAEAYYTYYEVSNRFWDVNTLATNGQINTYTYGQGKFTPADTNAPGLRLTATLVWDRHVDYTVNTDTNDTTTLGTLANTNLLSNLDLVLQQQTAPDTWADLYRSVSTVDNVEHIYMDELSATNTYRLEVVASDLVDQSQGEQYALAVSYLPIPEPSTVALAGAFAGVILGRRRWRRQRAALRRVGLAPRAARRAAPPAHERW